MLRHSLTYPDSSRSLGTRKAISPRCRMKATEAKLLDFLKKSPQFVIPIYQRTYFLDGKGMPSVVG